MSTTQPPVLGMCPRCESRIASYDVTIEYETPHGRPAITTECPDCRTVVNPE